jgi:hypothetical protein
MSFRALPKAFLWKTRNLQKEGRIKKYFIINTFLGARKVSKEHALKMNC